MFYQSFMSNVLEYIETNPQEAQRLLGLKYEQLKQLLEKVIELHNHKVKLAESKKVRIIRGGGGRTKIITTRTGDIDFNILKTFDNISTSWNSIWS